VVWNACALALRLALEELAGALPEAARPAFWPLLWERYVDSKLDYRSSAEALQEKFRQAGADGFGLLHWLEGLQERPALWHPSRTARRGAGPALCVKRQLP